MYKMLGEWIGCCAKAHDLRRLMAVVECDFKEAVRTVEHLGFKLEATLPMFFGEEPGYLYTMLISKEVSQWQG
jgi:RimJ/RimL family protein N-acetyltransferase